MTDEDSIITKLAIAVDKFKKIDILLNSAGIIVFGFLVSKSGKVLDNDDLWRVIKINLIGTINVSKYVARHMISLKEHSDRVIINISSIAGLEGGSGLLAYALSKGGIIGITLPMARDLG